MSLHEKSVATLKCVATCLPQSLPRHGQVSQVASLSVRCRPFNFWLQTVAIRGEEEVNLTWYTSASVGIVCMRTFVLKPRNLVIFLNSSETENRGLYGVIVGVFFQVIYEDLILFPNNWSKDALTFSSSVDCLDEIKAAGIKSEFSCKLNWYILSPHAP